MKTIKELGINAYYSRDAGYKKALKDVLELIDEEIGKLHSLKQNAEDCDKIDTSAYEIEMDRKILLLIQLKARIEK